ncbi:AbgT family transporter [Spongiibacter sp. KMU-166]|uniref:AbgT family transporter n=1 Tax=Spongiibacter thalassae TaxID=2721624 RepID=A0ABX1GHI0_9GAMM|nr:AbgT family transporter [Spongiibacter thalassae]NKI17947.1 AbgT family transporter [Spongiibacter thalassae]
MNKNTTVSLGQRWLNGIERAGNKLPHPALLFIILSVAVVVLSAVVSSLGVSATHPASGEHLYSRSLLSDEGLRWIIHNAVANFMGFAPVGSVIVAIMGIAVAEHSGLLAYVLKAATRRAPPRLLSAVIVFCGVISSIGFDSGYVVLIPLAALVFRAAGRSPLAGIAAAFAGVSGGYSANLMLGPVDAILAGISTESLRLVAPDARILVSANYYFIAVSTVFITVVGAWVTEKIVEPRLQAPADTDSSVLPSTDNSPAEGRAVRAVTLFSLVYFALLLGLVLPENGLLRNPDPAGLAALPLLKGIVVFIALYAAIAGMIFGRMTGQFRGSADGLAAMEKGMSTLSAYLVLMFFAAQFVNYFAWSGLGALAAVNGANALSALELSHTTLIVGFVLTSAMINLLIGSASAKWTLMAPIFIPMFYLLGVSPEAAQMAYRIGDSSTNIITPLMPYFGVVVAFMKSHDNEAGMGTLLAMMLPYSICFLLGWSLLLAAWLGAGLPLGPG